MPVTDQTLNERWRVHCPKGHTDFDRREYKGKVYCKSCEQMYRYDELVDTREQSVGGRR